MHLHYGWWVHGRSETEQRRMNLVNIFLQCFLVKLYCLSLLLLLVFFFCFLGFFGWRRQHNGSLMLWYSLALWQAANATDALEYVHEYCAVHSSALWLVYACQGGGWLIMCGWPHGLRTACYFRVPHTVCDMVLLYAFMKQCYTFSAIPPYHPFYFNFE